jgi:hypothetical protein
LNDDDLTPYNVALTINVDNGQFFNMLNFVEQAGSPTYMYNLNGNNCTAFSLSALAAGDVIIPSKTGTWVGHSGYDPGDLGQDLQAMPQMPGRSLATSGSSHPNFGSCF